MHLSHILSIKNHSLYGHARFMLFNYFIHKSKLYLSPYCNSLWVTLRVVENKWPNFEESFFNFNIEKVLMMPEEMMERKASDPKIIRNFNKVKTIKANGQMIFEEQQKGHSFAEFIANWPSNDIIGLWAYLKKHGQRLGGNTGPYALRALGKDTFILSRDVEAYFRAHDIITGGIQTKSSLNAIQASFNHWQQQCDLSLSQLSRLIAYATGDNHIHLEEVADVE